jgi:hypothetical protein
MKYRVLVVISVALLAFVVHRAHAFSEKLTVDCEKGICTLAQKDFDMLMEANHRYAEMILKLYEEKNACISKNKT